MNEAQKIDILIEAVEALLELKGEHEFKDRPLAVEVCNEPKSDEDIVQVAAYIPPSLKKLAEQRVRDIGFGMTMSKYIASLMRDDLQGKP